LWAPEGSGLSEGTVIPVHFKSNISQTWIVDTPGTEEKQEIPLWSLSVHKRKSQASAYAERFEPYAAQFALSLRDGLLFREKPENLARQVYRLRLDETVKLLRKVAGALVETGGQPLPGDWYLAMASDGTTGFIFSNQLAIWNIFTDTRPTVAANAPAPDARMMDIFDKTWRPEYFITMQDSGRVDLNRYQLRFGIFTDPARRQLRVELPWFSRAYNYTSIDRQDDGSFLLQPSGARIHFSMAGDLIFTPADSEITASVRRQFQTHTTVPGTIAPADDSGSATTTSANVGSTVTTPADTIVSQEPINFVFKQQTADPRSVIAGEERRRLNVLGMLVSAGEYFESLYSGILVITSTGRFTWMSYETLVPAIIPEGLGDTGEISADLFLSQELAGSWQGAFTLRFEANRRSAVSFVYRADQNSLTIVPVAADAIRLSTVVAVNPEQAIFFMRY